MKSEYLTENGKIIFFTMSAGDDGIRENEILYAKHMRIGKFPGYIILRIISAGNAMIEIVNYQGK